MYYIGALENKFYKIMIKSSANENLQILCKLKNK